LVASQRQQIAERHDVVCRGSTHVGLIRMFVTATRRGSSSRSGLRDGRLDLGVLAAAIRGELVDADRSITAPERMWGAPNSEPSSTNDDRDPGSTC